MIRAGHGLDRGLQAAAVLATAGVLCTAALEVSYAWDVWYYHLPFAARIVGLLPADAFVFHAANQARFEGLPLLGEALQGLVWRITGRPESTNLVAFASVPLLAWFLRRRLGVPWSLSLLGLFAIPLVQAHASSAYVDLPANAALAALVLLCLEAYATNRRVDRRTLVLGAACAAFASNTKLLLAPLALGGWLLLAGRAVWEGRGRGRLPWRRVGAALGASVLVLAWPLKNLALHHNPTFPVRMTLLGHALPGVEDPYSSSPRWLANAPEPLRFACSVLEVGVRPMSDAWRWTVDQYMPADSSGPRMGGFFGAYAAVELALLAWRAARANAKDRTARTAAVGFALLTAATSVMPQAHELRYYMSWMIVLVAVNRWLACRDGGAWPRAFGLVSLGAFATVLVVSRAIYVLPTGSTFTALLSEKVDAPKLAGVKDGERVCVQKAPFDMLWAAPFHPPRRYVVKEAEEPGECDGYRRLE